MDEENHQVQINNEMRENEQDKVIDEEDHQAQFSEMLKNEPGNFREFILKMKNYVDSKSVLQASDIDFYLKQFIESETIFLSQSVRNTLEKLDSSVERMAQMVSQTKIMAKVIQAQNATAKYSQTAYPQLIQTLEGICNSATSKMSDKIRKEITVLRILTKFIKENGI